MSKTPAKFLFLLLLLVAINSRADATEITSSDVYAQVLRIEQVTLELKHQLGLKESAEIPKTIKTELLARHVWAKTYMLMTKIALFREQRNLPAVRPAALEPQLNLLPYSNWAQCLRILTELEILEQALGLKITPPPLPVVPAGKRSIDVFNKLNQISAMWNVLIGGQISPSYVYAETMRLNEDVSAILQTQGVMDTAIPPAKQINAVPGDALDAGINALREIQRLQVQVGLEPVNLEEFHLDNQTARPQDVFNNIELLLTELQPIKIKLGMEHVITPVAEYYENKTTADATQVLGYIANRLHLLHLHQD